MPQQKIQTSQISGADIAGPASSTAGNIPTFSGTTGKVLQDSGTALTTLTAKAGTATNTFTGAQRVTPTVLSISSNLVAVNAAASNHFSLSLTANATLSNPTNLVAGQTYVISISQTASFTLAYGTLYKFPGGVVPTATTGSGTKDLLCMYYDGTVLLCNLGKAYA